MFRKSISCIIAVLLLSFAILSFPLTRNFVYARNYILALIHIIPPTGILFLAIGKKAVSWTPVILSIFTEVVIYFGVAWSSLPVSVVICDRIAPVLGLIAAVIIIIQSISDRENKGSDN